jgi:hypothetical protein
MIGTYQKRHRNHHEGTSLAVSAVVWVKNNPLTTIGLCVLSDIDQWLNKFKFTLMYTRVFT